MKMSRSSSKLKEEEDDESSGSESSVSEDADEDIDVEREETPDLYRNSALGMYAGVSVNVAVSTVLTDTEYEGDGRRPPS